MKIQEAYDNSKHTQCSRMLDDFKIKKQLDTFYFRRKGIMHPAGRVKDLRNDGHKIITSFTRRKDGNGIYHRVGLYCYFGIIQLEENRDV